MYHCLEEFREWWSGMWFRVKEGKWSQPLLRRGVATLKLEANSQHFWCFLLPMNLFPENGTTTLRQSSSLSSINTIAHLQYSLRIQVHPKEGITQPESDDEIGTVKPLPRMGLHSWGFTHCVENNNPQKSSCNCIITDHARRQVIWATKKNNPLAFHSNTGCFIKEILK